MGSFKNLRIAYDTAQTCAHVYGSSYYIDSRKVWCKVKWETMYIHLVLFKLPTKSLVIGPVILTLQHNVNSLWHAFINACNHVHWTWDTLNTHALTIFGYLLEVSYIRSSVVWEVHISVWWGSNLKIVHAIEGVKMVVMPTILGQSCLRAWNHYPIERPTYFDADCNFV